MMDHLPERPRASEPAAEPSPPNEAPGQGGATVVDGEERPANAWWALGLQAILILEVLALAAFRTPEERFGRFAFWDSGAELVVQDQLRQGRQPTIDFGHVYGLLPLLVGRAWYGTFGLSPASFRGLMLACSLATAWGLARFAAARRFGPAGIALVLLAIPDTLLPAAITLVHALEQALLVLALSEHAKGRRRSAVAIMTACLFVKPSMAYFYGLFLVVAIGLTTWRKGPSALARAFAPAALTGLGLAALLALVFGTTPLVNTLIPSGGLELYRESHYGFFHGIGRAFWALPGGGIRDYFRYEVGLWLLGTFLLIEGGLTGLGRLKRGASTRSGPGGVLDDELIAGCAFLHVAFVTLFFGNRGSWAYYFSVLVLGLATLARRNRPHNVAAWGLVLLLLVSDRSKLVVTARGWSELRPSAETLNLWASPKERAEWSKVLELTRGNEPALFALHDGAALLTPGFAPPISGYFDPGYALPAEIHRKAAQLASARMIVRLIPQDWRGFTLWPELADALDGCECLWQGDLYRVYRRTRPPARPLTPVPGSSAGDSNRTSPPQEARGGIAGAVPVDSGRIRP